ncbi:hypothetical protein D3C76_1664340 [compost metagenome]
MEGLRYIIIAAVLNSHNLIHIPHPGGDEQDRDIGHGTELSAPIKSVIVWKIDVKKHQMGSL